jgi:hypothetical protein
MSVPPPPPRIHRTRFQAAEDALLVRLVACKGPDSWAQIAASFPGRNARQCRDRWNHYLAVKYGDKPWTITDDIRLCRSVSSFGNQWNYIVRFFDGRSAPDLEKRWATLSLQVGCGQVRKGQLRVDSGGGDTRAHGIVNGLPESEKHPQPSRRTAERFRIDDRFWLGVALDHALNTFDDM